MRYSAVLLALAAGVLAVPQQGSSVTSGPASRASAALTSQQSCAIACPAADVNCQAACVGVARPNSSQVVQTNECAAKCDQGDGSAAATQKYSQCVQACIASYFPSSQTVGGPANVATSAASAVASLTGSAAAAASSAASQAASGTAKITGSGSAASAAASAAATKGAANINNVQAAGAGLAGLVMAMFAL